MLLEGRKDEVTVTPSGERIARLIEGVTLRPATTQFDERGELCEIYDPSWGIDPQPMVYAYSAFVKPGRIKGWVYHKQQSDRLFVVSGFLKIVLYDFRETSSTSGLINELHLTERNRALLVIPPFVVHAVQNVGTTEAAFVNLPTRPYIHSDPDKYRVDKSEVPYNFDRGAGW